MPTISDLLEAIEGFDPLDATLDAILENEKKAIELNQDQLLGGTDAFQEKLKEYRDDEYAELKNRMNPKPGYGTPDLKFTGDFYKGFFIDVMSLDEGYFELDSTDEKAESLTERYGEAIFGLDDAKETIFWIDNVFESFARILFNRTGIQMENV